jgi:hypothetical protein
MGGPIMTSPIMTHPAPCSSETHMASMISLERATSSASGAC